MADINTVGKQFSDFYYLKFDQNRQDLAPLYRDVSMLTFEGSQILGVTAIVEKLVSLPFQKVQHKVTTMDAQPSTDGKFLISITGQLLVDDEANPMPFTQFFQLAPDGGSYFVLNDIFRLNLG